MQSCQPQVDFKNIYSNLQKQFYVQVPFQIGQKAISEVVEAFFNFLALPENVKRHIDFSIAPTHRRGDVGFKHRDAEEHVYNDSKDFFHYHPAIFERYASFLKEHAAVHDFAVKAQPIWQMAAETVKEVLMSLESMYPGLSAKVFDTEHPHVLLRFLRYQWQQSGEHLAKPHFDAGSFTLAIAESCPGLRIGSCPADLKPAIHQEDCAIFMLSSNFQKLMPSSELLAGWHDVVQLNPALIGKPFARWAVVAFIEGAELEALPRSETNGN